MATILSTGRNSNAYWNEYYRERSTTGVSIPSQFAAFVASELLEGLHNVVDIGCGNGRDALFFARHGLHVVGVDASSEAVRLCQEEAQGLSAQFINGEVSDPSLGERIREAVGGSHDLVIYARFFLHAIDQETESEFLRLAYGLCRSGSYMALEFRTERDRGLTKVTSAHYRRYVDPLAFLTSAISHGFELAYFVEGFGYAKYKGDDAHVARVLLRRT